MFCSIFQFLRSACCSSRCCMCVSAVARYYCNNIFLVFQKLRLNISVVFFCCCNNTFKMFQLHHRNVGVIILSCCCNIYVLWCFKYFNPLLQQFTLCCCNNMIMLFRTASIYCCSNLFGDVATICS
ncbi:hypothetical protein SORBI_3008G119250 [Sorghum bicolor]|uniref:Uncharacterized protein n=1 Tax=Sorghum bicolor TaxID=4558 RepID=A0A1Z5R6A2_SORBI|nr:hypothetical protein SORBI_3008G119250 [Sorghum bicolor]